MTEAELRSAYAAILAGARPADLESSTLDFKEEPTDRSGRRSRAEVAGDLEKLVTDACLCFANGDGGVVVLGVTDRRSGTEAFLGTQADGEHLKTRIYARSQPPLLVDVREHHVHGVRVIEFHVPRGVDVHADSQGRAPRRVGTDCMAMSPVEIHTIRQDRMGFDFTAEPSQRDSATIDDHAVATCRQLLRGLTDLRTQLADLSVPDLLAALGLVDTSGRLNRAGDLLLCRPTSPLAVYAYKDTPGGEPRTVERLAEPLVVLLPNLLRLVSFRTNHTPVTLPSGQQLQVADFPELAVREAVTNALVHRDFRLMGVVAVDHSPHVLSVTSPGPLVTGVTSANILTTVSRPRNPSLMNAIRTLGLSEETGRGVDRMYRETIRSGQRVPTIVTTDEYVDVRFVSGAPNTAIARFVAQLPPGEQQDTDAMLVLMHLCNHESVTAETAGPLVQRSIDETELILQRLASDQVRFLDVHRPTARRRHPTYRLHEQVRAALGTAIAYRARNTDEIDRRITEHVREYGWITNRTVQNLFSVDVYQARRWLADLKKRNILRQTTEGRTTGPGIQYGPAGDFPDPSKRRRRPPS